MENIIADSIVAAIVLTGGTFALRGLSRRINVQPLPLYVCLPIFFTIGMVLYLPMSPVYLSSDGELYQAWGNSIAASWRDEGDALDRQLWPGKGFWPLIIAVLTIIVGPVHVTLIALNTIIFGGAIVAMQKATLQLSGDRSKWSMVVVVMTSVPFALFGASLLRESLFWLGVSGSVLALSYMRSHKIRLALIHFTWSALLLLAVRPDAGVVFAYATAGVLVVLIGLRLKLHPGVRASSIALALLVLALSAPSAFSGLREDADVSSITTVADALSDSGVNSAFTDDSSASEDAQTSAWPPLAEACDSALVVRVLCGGVENLPRALIGPFPWEYQGEFVLIAAGLATTHFLGIAVLAGFFISTRVGRTWESAAIVAVAGVSLLMFAAILNNYGILIRFRAATEILLIPLALSGVKAVQERIGRKSTRLSLQTKRSI